VTTPETFAARYPFALDEFQLRATEALHAGESVLVAAPTGSGKTVVAEYAVDRALERGGKCFYTTPLKAPSPGWAPRRSGSSPATTRSTATHPSW
jgi:ATP-dependent RNA helicase HelY